MINSNNGSIPDRPMKWHKFLNRFSLWLSALYLFGQAGILVSGLHYGFENERDQIYQLFTGLQSVDMTGALLYLMDAIFTIYTAIQLIKLKKKAPKKLMMTYIITAALPILYTLMACSSTGIPTAELIDESLYPPVIGCAVGLIVCKIYYDKRSHMFVH